MVQYSVEAGCCFCQECQYACPVHAITMDFRGAHIDRKSVSAAANARARARRKPLSRIESE